jgi:cold-inducible RNA-binding protein
MKLYVGNLPFKITENDLRSFFSEFGDVSEVFIPMDNYSGQARGFAFVTMDSRSSMLEAIKKADGREMQGRPLKVNEAKPQEKRGGDFRGGGNHSGKRDNYRGRR